MITTLLLIALFVTLLWALSERFHRPDPRPSPRLPRVEVSAPGRRRR